MGKITDRLWVC